MMDALEQELGLSLLIRNHRGIQLTEEGEALKPLIKDFLRANAVLENKIIELKKKKTETIRIAAYASIAMHWMPEIMYRFRRIRPDVNLELRMVDHALEPFELLESGAADVIFASAHDYGNLEWIPLYEEKMLAVLPQNFPVKSHDSFPVSAFDKQTFLMPYGRFDIDVESVFSNADVHPTIETSRVDDETLIRMVSRGLGVSMMSELMIRGRTDDVLCIPVEPAAIRELGMGFPLHAAEDPSIT